MTTTTNGISTGDAFPVQDDSKYVAHNLISKYTTSMTLKAVLKLGIPDILTAAEDKRPLSAAEILAQLPMKSTPGPTSIRNLSRLLNVMVREGVFSKSLNGNKESVYGLTEVSKWFIKDTEMSMLSIADLHLNPLSTAAWDKLDEFILDETTTPFEKAHRVPVFKYVGEANPELGAQLQGSMISFNWFQSRDILNSLRQSGILEGVTTLVDVGGSLGAFVGEIVTHYPHIQGVNFDLPYVVATAPAIKGVQHVGGSYVEGVPSGDAMFLKTIIHNHGDEEAVLILKNCFKALSKNGRVILAEYIVDEQDQSEFRTFVQDLDLMMLMAFKGARERTKEEYEELLKTAGFQRCKVVRNPGSVSLIVAFKD